MVTGSTIDFNKHCQEMAHIPASSIPLDSQLTVDVLMKGYNVTSITPCGAWYCTAIPVLHLLPRKELIGYRKVWYHPDRIANIPSL